MPNLTNPKVIWIKGGLFVLLGLISLGLLLLQMRDARSVILLLICIWSFCRAYYFAFYVIEKYIDPTYRFSGLYDFTCYTFFGQQPDEKTPAHRE